MSPTTPPSKPASKPTDWRARLSDGTAPRRFVLDTDFAGVPAGSTLYVPTPGLLADRVSAIPSGQILESRTLRQEFAQANDADATCPVTTALFLRTVAEAAWDDLQDGTPLARIVPFWRAIDPASPIATRLRCGPDWIRAMREQERTGGHTAAPPPSPE